MLYILKYLLASTRLQIKLIARNTSEINFIEISLNQVIQVLSAPKLLLLIGHVY